MKSTSRYPLASKYATIFNGLIDTRKLPVSLDSLFSLRSDIVCKPKNLRNKVLGYNSQGLDNKWTTFVEKGLLYPEKRLVVAHELFHILSNNPLCDSRRSMAPGQIKSVHEKAADQFALEFLMPSELLKSFG